VTCVTLCLRVNLTMGIMYPAPFRYVARLTFARARSGRRTRRAPRAAPRTRLSARRACASGRTRRTRPSVGSVERVGSFGRRVRGWVRREARRHHDVAASSSLESRRAGPTCDLHRVALDASRAEIAAVFSGVAARAPLIVTPPPRVRDSDGSRHTTDENTDHRAGFPAREKNEAISCVLIEGQTVVKKTERARDFEPVTATTRAFALAPRPRAVRRAHGARLSSAS